MSTIDQEPLPPFVEDLLSKAAALDMAKHPDIKSHFLAAKSLQIMKCLEDYEHAKYIRQLANITSYLTVRNEENKKALEKYRLNLQQSMEDSKNKENFCQAESVALKVKLNQYDTVINDMKKNLDKLSPNMDLLTLEYEIKDLNERLENIKSKHELVKTELEKFRNFPPNVLEGKQSLVSAERELQELKSSANVY